MKNKKYCIEVANVDSVKNLKWIKDDTLGAWDDRDKANMVRMLYQESDSAHYYRVSICE
jgi:hypothetical protein